MPNPRDIRKKISGVKNTQQITRAMKMVSTAKLRKAMERLNSTKFYLTKLEDLMSDLQGVLGDRSVLQQYAARPVNCAGIVVVTGDRGLCGSFNSDIIKAALRHIQQLPAQEKRLITFGRKGYDFFRRRQWPIISSYSEMNGNLDSDGIRAAARDAVALFLQDCFDELWIVFADFVTVLERKVIIKRLLPLDPITTTRKRQHVLTHELMFDPSPEVIFDALIPRFVEGLFLRAVLESATSEQAARMIAMGAATDKADEIISELTLFFNRTRQAIITKELSEVVAGADALSG
ncbi:MAG TPA: ATP synthase F1 subunit gamma [Candidatus Ozemobacteraceae bacterium]|nr:ATP synthase F1 subunit gamma [Candidatus Ozemobacteraceae bacterium]